MAEQLFFTQGADRAQLYKELRPQWEAVLSAESDAVANMANAVAILREVFGFFWVGFYRVVGDELVLGPFQGPLACTRIRKGKGVCGTAWAENRSILVPDVEQFPGHIACSSASRSELVVPIRKNGQVIGILDVDSDQLADFSSTDQQQLEMYMDYLAQYL
jgi:GAF domain-containing protein